MSEDEERILKRALGEKPQNLKHWNYTDNETLEEDVKQVYPRVAELIVVNADDKDSLGIPQITTRKIRKITANIHSATQHYRNRSVQSVTGLNADWQIAVCYVEKGQVTVKIAKCSLEGEGY